MGDLTNAGELEGFQNWFTQAFGENGFVQSATGGPTDNIPEAIRPIVEWISQ